MSDTRTFEGTSQEIIRYLNNRPTDHKYRITEVTDSDKSATAEEVAAADARLLGHAVDLYPPSGLDNERIDTDLARAYGSSHSVGETVAN